MNIPATSGVEHRRQRGAAIVEFSVVVVLLLVLLFGIITFGVILSFKQSMTQAAAEGARAGAMGTELTASGLAATAMVQPVGAFGKTCNSGGLTCTYPVAACGGSSTATCITVTVQYDYENHPLLPPIPGLGLLFPDTLTSVSVTQING